MAERIDAALFRETLGHYPTGVAVVTTIARDGRPAGMVVGTFSSVSLDPPLIAFFPSAASRSFEQIKTAPTFCVNVLAADQEQLCRQLATPGANKFDGVQWRPGPLGSPVLADAVSWIECTFYDIQEAGDHFIVLGLVHDLAVERSTLPLLFFQGGYGRFSPGSFMAGPDPDLIQAVRLAETIRPQIEEISTEFGVDCGVLVAIRGDAVQVLAANRSPGEEPFPLGHRQPIIPPLGAAFLIDATPQEVDDWLQQAPDESPDRRDLYLVRLEKVRRCGYSLLASDPRLLERQQAALSEFELSDRLPRHERAVRQATAELTEQFCPDLRPGELYDVASIVVPVAPFARDAGLPPMAIRMTGLPPAASAEQIQAWVHRLTAVQIASKNGNNRHD